MTNVWNREASISTEILQSCVMLCAIWYHLYNLKRKKYPWRTVTFSKVTGCFSRFQTSKMVPSRTKRLMTVGCDHLIMSTLSEITTSTFFVYLL